MYRILCVLLLAISSTAYSAENYHEVLFKSKSSDSNSTYASIFPVQKAALSSPMTGVIQKINFRPGDQFNQGDVLIQFDCEEVDLKSKRAQAELDAARAQLESVSELMRLNSTSKIELAKAESQFKISQADLNIINFQQKQCQVRAPYHGEVVHQVAQENETVKTDDPLIDIIDNRELEVRMYIPSIWLQYVHVNTPFTLHLDELPNQTFYGIVTKMVDQIDPASQSILIFGQLRVDDAASSTSSIDVSSKNLFSGMSGIAYFDFSSEHKTSKNK